MAAAREAGAILASPEPLATAVLPAPATTNVDVI